MLKEFAVEDQAALLHPRVTVGQVIVPEAVIVVPVVDRLHKSGLNSTAFRFVDRGVLRPVEVSLDIFDLRLYLEFADALLLVDNLEALSLASAISSLFVVNELGDGSELIFTFRNARFLSCPSLLLLGLSKSLQLLLLAVALFVLTCFTELSDLQKVELALVHHALAQLHVKLDLLCGTVLFQTVHQAPADGPQHTRSQVKGQFLVSDAGLGLMVLHSVEGVGHNSGLATPLWHGLVVGQQSGRVYHLQELGRAMEARVAQLVDVK